MRAKRKSAASGALAFLLVAILAWSLGSIVLQEFDAGSPERKCRWRPVLIYLGEAQRAGPFFQELEPDANTELCW